MLLLVTMLKVNFFILLFRLLLFVDVKDILIFKNNLFIHLTNMSSLPLKAPGVVLV